MARRKFDVSTVKSLSQFGFGQSRSDRDAEELKLRQEEEMREMQNRPHRVSSSDIGQGFSMEEGINPWEISAPEIPAILICSDCGADVEEVNELPAGVSKSMGELVAGSYPKSKSAFCFCPKCGNTNYFMVELLRMKSWRREFPKADILPETYRLIKG